MDTAARAQSSRSRPFGLPRLVLADGTVEALKWLAMVLMTIDHVNKYLLDSTIPALFAAGRLALPLFGFLLAYNLAQPNSLSRGAYLRLMKRLAIYATIACVPFIALGGLGWGWWPLNIMATLLTSAGVMYLVEMGGKLRLSLAVLLFIVGGVFVEFWWPGISLCLAAWRYCKRPSWPALLVWIASISALYLINRNLWALAALPLVFAAPHIHMKVPRLHHMFYVYYPAHLGVLWLLTKAIH